MSHLNYESGLVAYGFVSACPSVAKYNPRKGELQTQASEGYVNACYT